MLNSTARALSAAKPVAARTLSAANFHSTTDAKMPKERATRRSKDEIKRKKKGKFISPPTTSIDFSSKLTIAMNRPQCS